MERKVGRNDPCPCGSGKKFKKCCEQTLIGKKFRAQKLDSSSLAEKTAKVTQSLSGLFQKKSPEKTEENPSNPDIEATPPEETPPPKE
jgi:hypothetical protein